VFYELAIRHAIKRPVVQIIDSAETIPFDVVSTRTIHVDHHDLDSAARARDEIERQIRAVEKNPFDVDTPISVAIELQALRKSDNPIENSNAEIMEMLSNITNTMNKMHAQLVAFQRMRSAEVEFKARQGSEGEEYPGSKAATLVEPAQVINLMEVLKRSLAAEANAQDKTPFLTVPPRVSRREPRKKVDDSKSSSGKSTQGHVRPQKEPEPPKQD
jgi:hypothetical protein